MQGRQDVINNHFIDAKILKCTHTINDSANKSRAISVFRVSLLETIVHKDISDQWPRTKRGDLQDVALGTFLVVQC